VQDLRRNLEGMEQTAMGLVDRAVPQQYQGGFPMHGQPPMPPMPQMMVCLLFILLSPLVCLVFWSRHTPTHHIEKCIIIAIPRVYRGHRSLASSAARLRWRR
jgi:hypothetical protein